MKAVQIECFQRNKMSMNEYNTAMFQYEEKLRMTIEEQIRVESILSNMMKFKGKKKALNVEMRKINELIRSTQDDYLNKGKLETRVYENMLKTYAKRLAEIEESITSLETEEELKKLKFFRRIFNKKNGAN